MLDEQKAAAIETLNKWLAEHGVPDASTTPDDWNINPFEDALLFARAERRPSNRLSFVRGEVVFAFSPSTTSFDEGYAQLGHPEGPLATAWALESMN